MEKMLHAIGIVLTLVLICGLSGPLSALATSEFKVFQVEIASHKPQTSLEIQKDFYINGGTAHGLKESMLLDVFRPKTVVDYDIGREYVIRIFVGQLRVIQVYEVVAIARIHAIDKSAKNPVLRHDTVMIGDYAIPAETDLLASDRITSTTEDEDKNRFILPANVLFAFNKWHFNEKAGEALSKVLSAYTELQDHTLIVAGHTCNVGDKEYNRNLSMKRAQSVASYLVQKGVPATQVRVECYGESSPIAPNDTEENRSRNRRVEVRLIAPSVS